MENKTEIDNANDYWFSIDFFGQPAWTPALGRIRKDKNGK